METSDLILRLNQFLIKCRLPRCSIDLMRCDDQWMFFFFFTFIFGPFLWSAGSGYICTAEYS